MAHHINEFFQGDPRVARMHSVDEESNLLEVLLWQELQHCSGMWVVFC